MASSNMSYLNVNPAVQDRKASIALLDTAEELVDSLDNLSVCLKQIEDKYLQKSENEVDAKDNSGNLYDNLKESLDATKDLTETLKREKWRLSRRELSLNLRMGELEDYKKHMKEDMTDMNMTVESLSMRIIQLENALCEQQEIQESLEAEQKELKSRLQESEEKCSGLEDHNDKLQKELKQSRFQRSDSYLKRRTEELQSEMEVLHLENHNLKEMIREKDEILDKTQCNCLEKSNEITANDVSSTKIKANMAENDGGKSKEKLTENTTFTPVEVRIEYV